MLGNDEQAAYGAAKAGLVGLMNVLSQEGRAHGVLCNALMPTAMSRMAEAMPAWQMEKVGALFQEVGREARQSMTPEFVTPLVTYLVSEACQSTHAHLFGDDGPLCAGVHRHERRLDGAAQRSRRRPRTSPPISTRSAALTSSSYQNR